MKTKICSQCQKETPLSGFNKNRQSPDGLQWRCRECDNRICKEAYHKDSGRYKKYAKQRSKDTRAWFVELKKQKQCAKCGDNRWYVLDFHHHNDDKNACVARLVAHGHSKKKIMEEVKKCTVLCANCHREAHYLAWAKGWLNGRVTKVE